MHLLAHEPIPVELEDADDRNRDAATAWWNARPFAVMRAGDDPFYEYTIVHVAQPGGLEVQIGQGVHYALLQLPHSLLAVTRFTIQLVARLVEGGDYRLDVVPVFRLGVLIDDCLAALAKVGAVVDRCHRGPFLDASTASSIASDGRTLVRFRRGIPPAHRKLIRSAGAYNPWPCRKNGSWRLSSPGRGPRAPDLLGHRPPNPYRTGLPHYQPVKRAGAGAYPLGKASPTRTTRHPAPVQKWCESRRAVSSTTTEAGEVADATAAKVADQRRPPAWVEDEHDDR